MRNRVAIALLTLASLSLTGWNYSVAQESPESNRKILTRVTPQYPGLARSLNIQGKVRADVLVAPNGNAKSVAVVGGHPLLAQSAQDALRQWKWEPTPHETHEIIEIKFKP